MSSTVYSKRFASVIATTAQSLATVPVGKVWVVKCVTAYSQNGNTVDVAGATALGAWFCVFQGRPTTGPEAFVWSGMVVLNAGEVLGLTPVAGPWSLIASGYELGSA